MELKTYRASSLPDALALVRRELGPDAAVLHTRELGGNLWHWFTGQRGVEITASCDVDVPSRLPQRAPVAASEATSSRIPSQRASGSMPAAHEQSFREQFRRDLKLGAENGSSLLDQLQEWTPTRSAADMPDALCRLFTVWVESDVSPELARELVERLQADVRFHPQDDLPTLRARAARWLEDEIRVTGPLVVAAGQRRRVALVGPTGVGKTTTIAKLAAHYRLREKRRVGLITVDTYRIAAIDQQPTYPQIIYQPLEVVSTPREMREAAARLASLDLVLIDTAGRSPRDHVRIQELKSLLAEAAPDEVQLVLSAAGSEQQKTAAGFAEVGATSLVLTKLDEALGASHLLPLLRSTGLPVRYVTNGQNVPDDIEPAESRRLARWILGSDR